MPSLGQLGDGDSEFRVCPQYSSGFVRGRDTKMSHKVSPLRTDGREIVAVISESGGG